MLLLLYFFFLNLFILLLLKDKKWKKQINNDTTYEFYLGERTLIIFCGIIVILNAISFVICYTIIAFYLNILILIVSLFTKFYPVKYSVGILGGLLTL